MAGKNKQKQSGKNTRGALYLIAGLFLASGLLRLGSGTGSAIAREVEALSNSAQTEALQPEPEPAACQTDEAIGELLSDLKQREERIRKTEAELEDRRQAIAVAEEGIRQNLEVLAKAEQRLKATIATAETAAEDDLSRLTSVYENMKPKDAALLFEEMDPQFSAGFLGRMRPDAAAAIFAGLSPEKAYSISVILAGRNANVPTE